MSRYLWNKFKGKYRVKSKYDLDEGEFPRDLDGNFEEENLYIDCTKGTEIWHYGNKILCAYVPSLGRGRNIVRTLEEMKKEDIIVEYIESDKEVDIYFDIKDIDIMAELCKCKQGGSSISPFSVKNLPKSKHKWNKYESNNKEKYDEMLRLVKEWIKNQHMQIGKGYKKFYKEFGKKIKFDIIEESEKKNYKPLHIIDLNGFTDDAIEWLNKRL